VLDEVCLGFESVHIDFAITFHTPVVPYLLKALTSQASQAAAWLQATRLFADMLYYYGAT